MHALVLDTLRALGLPTRARFVMAGLVPAIHVYKPCRKDVDARDKPGMTEGADRRDQGR
jgi:hypothetical protein